MKTTLSDEIRQQYIDKLGPDFGEMFYTIQEEWVRALDRYQELMELFGQDGKQIALLNVIGPGFFADLQEVLSNDLILRLTRLTDTDNRAVSVCHLPRFLRNRSDLKKQVELHVSQAKKHAASARIRRNRRIAHRDKSRPDESVKYEDLKAGLDSVHAALNVVETGFWKNHLMNEVVSQLRTAKFLIRLESLVKGVLFIESRIDPTGDVEPYGSEVEVAFLAKIGGDPDQDLEVIRSLRIAARTIKTRLDEHNISERGGEN